jgi:hypothetical protein
MSTTYSGWGRYTWGSATWGEPTTVELVSVTGVNATHAIGSFAVELGATTVSVTGVSASNAIGSPAIISNTLDGWGRGRWSSGPWGEPTTITIVDVTGVSAATTVGTITAVGSTNITVPVTGVSADAFPTGGFGRSTWGSSGWGVPVGVIINQGTGTSVSATALLMTSFISNITLIEGGGISVGISSGINAVATIGAAVVKQEVVFPTGVSATSTVESVDVGLGFGVTGVDAVPSIGAINITQGTGITVTANSVNASSTVNSATVVEGSGVSTTVSGVLTTSHIGVINVPDVILQITGVSAQGLVGTPTVWSEIIPGQNAGWIEISDTQSPVWTEIAA